MEKHMNTAATKSRAPKSAAKPPKPGRKADFKSAKAAVFKKYDSALRRLAQ